MLHNINLFLSVVMMVEHLICTIQIGNNQVDIFLISARPGVDDSGVKISILFDGSLHSSEGEFLFFVVSIPTHLNSHWTNEARIHQLHFGVFLVHEFTLIDKLWQGDWSACFSTADHSFVEHQSWILDWAFFIKGAFNGLNKVNLTLIWFDI